MFSFFFFTLDFDECQNNQTNSCSQLCINAPGSYSCACQNGYSLNDDKESCDGTYDNSNHHHRSLVIVDNSLVVNYHFALRIVKLMALVVHHLLIINRACAHKVLIFYLRSERYILWFQILSVNHFFTCSRNWQSMGIVILCHCLGNGAISPWYCC